MTPERRVARLEERIPAHDRTYESRRFILKRGVYTEVGTGIVYTLEQIERWRDGGPNRTVVIRPIVISGEVRS